MIGQERHSAVEYLVFGLALALVLVLGYQGVKRVAPALLARWSGQSPSPSTYRAMAAGDPAAPQAPGAVGFVAPVKIIPGGRSRRKTVSIPPPARR